MTDVLKRTLRSPQGVLGMIIVGLIMLVVLFGPCWRPMIPRRWRH